MFEFLEKTFGSFRGCFGREEAYCWFVIIVMGIILRDDKLGVTSVIRALCLDGACYETMLHFFYSHAWSLDSLRRCWYEVLKGSKWVMRVDGRCVLVGDGVKESKEGYYMPGVKKLFQESEDQSKGEYIFGHMFGAVGVVASKGPDVSCIPLRMSIQDGISAAASWEGSGVSGESHLVQIVRNGFEIAETMGESILLLDRYFLAASVLKTLDVLNKAAGKRQLDIVTKAKRGCVAYEKPPGREPGKKGRPRKKGDSLHLDDFFEDTSGFEVKDIPIYGGTERVSYLVKDLLWGKGLYREVRFVIVSYGSTRSVLVSTDTSLSGEAIIELYGRRFRIETCFREFKQQIAGFGYHFWTKAIGKLNHFKKREEPSPIERVQSEENRKKVLGKIRATECFVHLCCIAMGTIQLLSFDEAICSELNSARYLRTYRRNSASEATARHYLFRHFFAFMEIHHDSPITRIIQRVRNWGNRKVQAG